MSSPSCLVPVATLVASPFSLSAGDTVVVIIQARNARGWGPLSDENTSGAIIITVPHQMDAPVRVDSATTTSQIKISWIPLVEPENGMSAI